MIFIYLNIYIIGSKKLLSILVVSAIAILVASTPVFAQSNKDVKAAKKEAKTAAKQLKKEGFKLLELGDIEVQLGDYLVEAKSGQKQIVGTADDIVSPSLTAACVNDQVQVLVVYGGADHLVQVFGRSR